MPLSDEMRMAVLSNFIGPMIQQSIAPDPIQQQIYSRLFNRPYEEEDSRKAMLQRFAEMMLAQKFAAEQAHGERGFKSAESEKERSANTASLMAQLGSAKEIEGIRAGGKQKEAELNRMLKMYEIGQDPNLLLARHAISKDEATQQKTQNAAMDTAMGIVGDIDAATGRVFTTSPKDYAAAMMPRLVQIRQDGGTAAVQAAIEAASAKINTLDPQSRANAQKALDSLLSQPNFRSAGTSRGEQESQAMLPSVGESGGGMTVLPEEPWMTGEGAAKGAASLAALAALAYGVRKGGRGLKGLLGKDGAKAASEAAGMAEKGGENVIAGAEKSSTKAVDAGEKKASERVITDPSYDEAVRDFRKGKYWAERAARKENLGGSAKVQFGQNELAIPKPEENAEQFMMERLMPRSQPEEAMSLEQVGEVARKFGRSNPQVSAPPPSGRPFRSQRGGPEPMDMEADAADRAKRAFVEQALRANTRLPQSPGVSETLADVYAQPRAPSMTGPQLDYLPESGMSLETNQSIFRSVMEEFLKSRLAQGQ